MPLIRGSGRKIISQNVEELVKSQHPRRQAVAIALKLARQSGKYIPPPKQPSPSNGMARA